MNQQKPRRIGMGMKPRGEEEILPTTEGQEVPALEGKEEAVPVTVEGGDLESVVTEVPAAVAEKEPIVASNEVLDPLAEALKASEGIVRLKLYQHGDIAEPLAPTEPVQNLDSIIDAGQQFPVTLKDGTIVHKFGGDTPFKPKPPKAEDLVITKSGREKLAEAAGVDAGEVSPEDLRKLAEKMVPVLSEGLDPRKFLQPNKRYAIGMDSALGADKTVAAVVEVGPQGGPDRLVEMLMSREEIEKRYPILTLDKDGSVRRLEPQMGELPTGEYRHTVRIAEAYVEGAKQQAEADNMALEDWLSLQLNTYLENWWYANGPK